MLAETCLKRGIDLPVYVTYYRKSDKVYIIDKPVQYSQLAQGKTKEEIATTLLNRCNELGKMKFSKEFIRRTKKENQLDQ